jgi:hypothetical protein
MRALSTGRVLLRYETGAGRTILAIILIGLLVCPNAAEAWPRYWNPPGSGQWDLNSNWRNGLYVGDPGVPEDGDYVHLNTSIGPGLWTVTYNNATPNDVYPGLYIGEDAGGDIQLRLDTGTDLTVGGIDIGIGGKGSVRHTDGTLTAGGMYMAMNNTSDKGSYRMTSSQAIVNSGLLKVGVRGTANFYQQAGTVTLSGRLYVGDEPISKGNYEMSGGTLTVNTFGSEYGAYIGGEFNLGGNGAEGAFLHSAGTVNASGKMVLAYGENSTGLYHMSGSGVLNVGKIVVGRRGHGTFQQDQGTTDIDEELSIGRYPDSGGDCNVSGGSMSVGTYVSMGYDSSISTFDITGGSVDVGENIYLGVADGDATLEIDGTGKLTVGGTVEMAMTDIAVGKLLLPGGACTIKGSLIARDGYSQVTVDGGVLIVEGPFIRISELRAGYSAGSTGHLDIVSHHTVTTYSDQIVGWKGIGDIVQNGGSNTCRGDLAMGADPLGDGTYTLVDGTFEVLGDTHVGYAGTGWIHQKGGSGRYSGDLSLGSQSNAVGTYTFDKGAFNGDKITVGNEGAGVFTQNGGDATADTMLIAADSSGSGGYGTGDGTMLVGSVYIGGRPDEDGGPPIAGGEGSMTVTGTAYVEVNGWTDNAIHLFPANHLNLGGGTLSLADEDALEFHGGGQVNFTFGTLELRRDTDLGATFLDEVFGSSHEIPAGRHLRMLGAGNLTASMKLGGGELSASELTGISNFTFDTGRFNKLGSNLVIGAGGTFGPMVTVAADQYYHAQSSVVVAASGHSIGTGGTISGTTGILNEGVMDFREGVNNLRGNVETASDSHIRVSSTAVLEIRDDLVHNGHIITAGGGHTVVRGDWSGTGDFPGIGKVYFHGTLQPGSSTATVDFGGDVKLEPGSLLEVEIDSLASFDKLIVAGHMTIFGDLHVDVDPAYTPVYDDVFPVITYASHRGRFDNVSGLDLVGDLHFKMIYGQGAFVLRVVPEPTTLTVLALGGLAIVRRKRKNRPTR